LAASALAGLSFTAKSLADAKNHMFKGLCRCFLRTNLKNAVSFKLQFRSKNHLSLSHFVRLAKQQPASGWYEKRKKP